MGKIPSIYYFMAAAIVLPIMVSGIIHFCGGCATEYISPSLKEVIEVDQANRHLIPSGNITYTQSPNQCYFTRQGDDMVTSLTTEFGNAQLTLDIAIYSLTEPKIVKSITDAYRRGVRVRVITDRVQSAGATQKHAINDLLIVGVPVKWDEHSGIMHLKMSVVDHQTLIVGSYNYTRNASTVNDEILIITHDQVQRSEDEFNRMWTSPDYVDAKIQ